MKKLMTLMLGLSLLSGMAVFAQDKNTSTDTMKSTKKTKKSKKTKTSTTSTTSSVQ